MVRGAPARSDYREPVHASLLVDPAQVIGWIGVLAACRGLGSLRPISKGVTEHKILVRRG